MPGQYPVVEEFKINITCGKPIKHTCVKWSALKTKVFGIKRSNFFPFRVDPFSEGSQSNFERVVSLENISIPLKLGQSGECGIG